MIRLKRIYDAAEATDGRRILVDRLWPRGVSREKAALDEWLRDVSPSPELRTWFGHDPAKFEEFRARYLQELEHNPAARELAGTVRGDKPVTLLFAAKDTEHNQAVVLREFLQKAA